MRPCKEEEKKLYVGSKYFPMYIYLIDYNENYIITKKYIIKMSTNVTMLNSPMYDEIVHA